MSVDEDDEAVYCFGRNSRGQLGLGHKNAISPSLPVRIPSLSSLPVRVTAVFCGYDHAFALTAGDDVFAWGRNSKGQLGLGNTVDQPQPQKVRLLCGRKVVTVVAGAEHSLALTAERVDDADDATAADALAGADGGDDDGVDGRGARHRSALDVYSFGGNALGQLGLGRSTAREQTPQRVPALAARVAGHLESVELLRRETVIDLSAEYGAAATAPLSSEGARRRPTSLGTVFASACRDELGAACCVINGGPIKGERAYADARVTFGELQTELPFPVKMVVVPARVADVAAALGASRAAGAEPRGYLQACDRLAALVARAPPDAVVELALPRNLLRGFCGIAPLVELGRALDARGTFPGEDSFVPAINLVVAHHARAIWTRLGSFDELDLNRDGIIDESEVAAAFERRHGRAPSAALLRGLMAAVDADGSGAVDRDEYDAAQRRVAAL